MRSIVIVSFLIFAVAIYSTSAGSSVCVTDNCKSSLVGQKAMLLSTTFSRNSVSASSSKLIEGMNQVEQREILMLLEESAHYNPRAFMGNEAIRSQSVSGDYETLATVAFSLAIIFFSCAIIYLIIRVTCVIRRSDRATNAS